MGDLDQRGSRKMNNGDDSFTLENWPMRFMRGCIGVLVVIHDGT